MMKKIYFVTWALYVLPLFLFSQQNLLNNPPAIPEIFAPGFISDEFGNRDMAISPKGDELFYTLQYRGFAISAVMYSKKVNGQWSAPEVAAFSGMYSDLEPAFSSDGTKLYFSSNRPVNNTEKKDFDIWYVTKKDGTWGDPQNMGDHVNTAADEFYPSVAKSGNIYFTREMEAKGEDIVVCKFINNQYDTAVSLPAAVNSTGAEFNAFVDPDEKFILFTGYKRKGNFGIGDLFISTVDEQGNWMEARNMGDKINSAGLTYCPYVSPDKKYFFFTSARGIFKTPFAERKTIATLRILINSTANGLDNIYWMSAKGIAL